MRQGRRGNRACWILACSMALISVKLILDSRGRLQRLHAGRALPFQHHGYEHAGVPFSVFLGLMAASSMGA